MAFKTLKELGFIKDYYSDAAYQYVHPSYKDNGSLRILFNESVHSWEIHGWGEADSELAMAIVLELIKNKWLEV